MVRVSNANTAEGKPVRVREPGDVPTNAPGPRGPRRKGGKSGGVAPATRRAAGRGKRGKGTHADQPRRKPAVLLPPRKVSPPAGFLG